MHRVNLRAYKTKLREEAKAYRHNLSSLEKHELDCGVLRNVLKLREYKIVKHCMYTFQPKLKWTLNK